MSTTIPSPATMTAARLYGPKDLRIDQIPHPGAPGLNQVRLRVTAVGICGSDLHTYQDARIGDTPIHSPLTLGHEFAGVVEALGPGEQSDGEFHPLKAGARVAVDPAQPCGRCEMCEQGHPNLCRRLHFCGLYPDPGSLSQWMHVPAHTCFPVPDSIDDASAALLEPLGVAIHATDLAKLRVADSVAILGAGSIGLCLLQSVRLSGASPIFVVDQFPWRLAVAEELGAIPINFREQDPVKTIQEATSGRGVDVAIEAAWADHSIQWAAEMARLGGRLVLVGIPGNNQFVMNHATARRKGLTIRMSRRMKHVYPRAIHLVANGMVNLDCLISHRFPLERAPEAFALNDAYQDHVVKVILEVNQQMLCSWTKDSESGHHCGTKQRILTNCWRKLMKAVICARYGPPDVLQLKEVEKPTPKDNEVLIKVHVSVVGPADCAFRKGEPFVVKIIYGLTRPRLATQGVELAGEIEAVGKDVKFFKKGDQVFGISPDKFGAHAEYLCLPEDKPIVIKPTNMTYEEAVAVCDGALTAVTFLRDEANIQSGQKILINGASGAVGAYAVQLAKYYGADVTGVCSTTNLELVKSLGADRVIDYTKENLTKSGQTYDVIFDAVGKSSFSHCKGALTQKGVYLSTVPTLAIVLQMLWTLKSSGKKARFTAAGLRQSKDNLCFLIELFQAEKIRAVIDRRYPLEQIAEAHRYVEKGHKKGNVIITVKHNYKT